MILITTSRRTNNRVRSFVKDLHSVYTESYRFNRGGLNNEELLARVRVSGADAAFIVYQQSGNPGRIRVIRRDRSEETHIMIDSVVLRRECSVAPADRISGLRAIVVPENATPQTRALSVLLSEVFHIPTVTVPIERPIDEAYANHIDIRLRDLPDGHTLWTHHRAQDQTETGPRIRVYSIRVVSRDEQRTREMSDDN